MGIIRSFGKSVCVSVVALATTFLNQCLRKLAWVLRSTSPGTLLILVKFDQQLTALCACAEKFAWERPVNWR